jgi:glucose-6-phosphate 1-dehydrogenase
LKFLERVYGAGYEFKVLLEKPFGEDLESAVSLKDFIENSSLKEKVFVSDHYLFKESFLKLLEDVKDFKKVKIASLEEVGLEGRISYYDNIGALKDMVQSHFLSLISKNLNFEIDLGKISVLDFVKGQYKGYVDELGKKSDTETFVYLKFECCGKEFEFITGKGFDKKESFVEVDGKKFEDEFDNSYVEIFKRFFSGDKNLMKDFPTIEDSLLGWEIIEKIEEFGKGEELKIYERGCELSCVLGEEKNS